MSKGKFTVNEGGKLIPFNRLFWSNRPRHRKLDWQPDMEQAFRKAKVALSEAVILAHP